MSRLAGVFADLRSNGRKGLIPYVVAGDPTPEGTVYLLHQLVAAGADVLEVGVPFSDPMSEGPVIQKGHERALENGMTLRKVLEIVAAFRRDNQNTPVVMMGYANPIERFGYDAFASACAEAGVDGLITVDLPPEEVDQIDRALQASRWTIFFSFHRRRRSLVSRQLLIELAGLFTAWRSKGDRVRSIGYRGGRPERRLIRSKTSLPVAVGFGIKDADSARVVASSADAVVVGSALIAEMERASQTDGDIGEIQIHGRLYNYSKA
ncbi:MAG: tryptophan synthase alpha chain [Cellvibrionales bacterium]|nr:MAG: tryptophan synthase alpha chain [Cellvibrionales bacterium]